LLNIVGQSVTIPAGGGTVPLVFPLTMPSINVTYGANQITIDEDGTYTVALNLLLGTTTEAEAFTVSVSVNGTPVLALVQDRTTDTVSLTEVNIAAIAALASGDVVTAELSAVDAVVLPVLYASLTVNRIG
jgi:hypothetical protein